MEEIMSTLVGFGTFTALPEEQISEKISRRILSGDQGMIVWWSIGFLLVRMATIQTCGPIVTWIEAAQPDSERSKIGPPL
jgi:hypothetical protein